MAASQMMLFFKKRDTFQHFFSFLFKINQGLYRSGKLIKGTFEGYSKILNPCSTTTQYVKSLNLGADCKLVSNTTEHINLSSSFFIPSTHNLLTLWPPHKKHDCLIFRVFLSIKQCTCFTLIIFQRWSQSALVSLLTASHEEQSTGTWTARETPLIGSWEAELSRMI